MIELTMAMRDAVLDLCRCAKLAIENSVGRAGEGKENAIVISFALRVGLLC